MISYDDFLEMVMKRRSIRSFKPDPIPDDDIEKIIEAARWSPSGANSQPWEFVVVKDNNTKDKIYEIIATQGDLNRKVEQLRPPELMHRSGEPGQRPGYMKAPVFIVACGDPRLKMCFPANVALSTKWSRDNLISGMASAFLYMHLAAHTLGIATQWVSSIHPELAQALAKSLLGIPEELEIYDMLALGYAAGQPRRKLTRAKEAMIHREKFDPSKFKTDERIREFVKSLKAG